MNIIILPILLGFGVSHGLYLLHRFLEGTSPMVACIGLVTTLVVSFTVLAAVMQLMHDQRLRLRGQQPPATDGSTPAARIESQAA